MMRLGWSPHLSVLFAAAALLSGTVVGADAEHPLDVIHDVDVEFLLGNPRLPWGSDPFRKLAGIQSADAPPEKLQLQGVAFRAHHSIAIVNGRTVSVGDLIQDRRVVEIGPHYIVLEKGDSLTELVISPPKAKEP